MNTVRECNFIETEKHKKFEARVISLEEKLLTTKVTVRHEKKKAKPKTIRILDFVLLIVKCGYPNQYQLMKKRKFKRKVNIKSITPASRFLYLHNQILKQN